MERTSARRSCFQVGSRSTTLVVLADDAQTEEVFGVGLKLFDLLSVLAASRLMRNDAVPFAPVFAARLRFVLEHVADHMFPLIAGQSLPFQCDAVRLGVGDQQRHFDDRDV